MLPTLWKKYWLAVVDLIRLGLYLRLMARQWCLPNTACICVCVFARCDVGLQSSDRDAAVFESTVCRESSRPTTAAAAAMRLSCMDVTQRRHVPSHIARYIKRRYTACGGRPAGGTVAVQLGEGGSARLGGYDAYALSVSTDAVSIQQDIKHAQ